MSTDILVWMPTVGYKDDNLGECIFVTVDFSSFVTTWPPAAVRVQAMWDNGWEIYIQPTKFKWVNADDPEKAYVTTYKRRNMK